MWAPLSQHSDGSLGRGIATPKKLVARLAELGHTSAALTDYGNVARVPAFFRECKDAKIKAIAGVEVWVCKQHSSVKAPENLASERITVLAKNKKGWGSLMRLVSASNKNFDRGPRLSLEEVGGYDDLIVFTGRPGSGLANSLFKEPRLAYGAATFEDAKSCLREDWADSAQKELLRLRSLFKELHVEIQLFDRENMPACEVVARALRWSAKKVGLRCLATTDSFYVSPEDAPDQRVVLARSFKTTLKDIHRRVGENASGPMRFLRSNRYHVYSGEELARFHPPEELSLAGEIADSCESYALEEDPLLPAFDCPGGARPDDHFKELCRGGWKKKILRIDRDKRAPYEERIKHELGVLIDAGLSSYFLIVEDYARFAREKLGAIVGERGSAAGCLVSYLTGITNLDPVVHDLMFSRFYSASRKGALPDIDLDFPVALRDRVIEYIVEKYGAPNVAQMATFARNQGRGALKEVLSAHSVCSHEEQNKITKPVPDQAAVSDDLQDMEEEFGESSVVRWALENRSSSLKEWCWLEDGELQGPMARYFEQAIRLEGVWKQSGRHASGVVVCSRPVEEVFPLLYDKTSRKMLIGLDYRDAEKLGAVKVDVLGNLMLDRLMGARACLKLPS